MGRRFASPAIERIASANRYQLLGVAAVTSSDRRSLTTGTIGSERT